MSLRDQAKAMICAAFSMASVVWAADIERPAGKVPGPDLRDEASFAPRYQTAKSVLVPLRRKMDIAAAELPSAAGGKGSATKSIQTAPKKAKNPDPQKKENVGAAAETSKPVRPSLAHAADNASPLGDDTSPDVDPWDSAVRRFDQQDPSKSVSNGVRVEDIIEPTSDYQYTASRRKNPFVPGVVLGRSAKQKVLSPNDVEIPIISPLQSVPVSMLVVIGVWEGEDHVLKALIETPTNQGIEAKLGDPAGSSGGRIMQITPESVIVREFFVRPDGTREYSDKPIKMGGDSPVATNELPGERWVLRPGASAPELDKGQPTGSILTTPPPAIPSGVPGKLSTQVPQFPAAVESNPKNKNVIQSPVLPISVQGGQ